MPMTLSTTMPAAPGAVVDRPEPLDHEQPQSSPSLRSLLRWAIRTRHTLDRTPHRLQGRAAMLRVAVLVRLFADGGR